MNLHAKRGGGSPVTMLIDMPITKKETVYCYSDY